MAPRPKPDIDPLIRQAIKERRLLWLHYKDRERVVEPHDYGIHNGLAKLLAYQIGGSSSEKLPNWRWVETRLISDIRLLPETFPGGRPAPSGKHHRWDKLFVRVEPADHSQ